MLTAWKVRERTLQGEKIYWKSIHICVYTQDMKNCPVIPNLLGTQKQYMKED